METCLPPHALLDTANALPKITCTSYGADSFPQRAVQPQNQMMDITQLQQGTNIDQGSSGVTISTGKPMLAGGLQTVQPPLGFMNPVPTMKELMERYTLHSRKDFNASTKTYDIPINRTFITSSQFSTSFGKLFNNTTSAISFQFVILVHSTFNTNGLIAAWFDPGSEDIYDNIKSEMQGTKASDLIVDAFNLDAVFVNLNDPNEIHITVPINNPINTINDVPLDYIFGRLRIAVLFGPYFGTGTSSFNIEVYSAPIEPIAHPLDNVG